MTEMKRSGIEVIIVFADNDGTSLTNIIFSGILG